MDITAVLLRYRTRKLLALERETCQVKMVLAHGQRADETEGEPSRCLKNFTASTGEP